MYKWYLGLRCMQSFEIWFVPWSCCPFCMVAVGGTVMLMSPLVTACISGMLCNTTWLIVDSQNFPWSPQAPFLLFSLPTYYWTSNETGVPGAHGGITAPNCIVQARVGEGASWGRDLLPLSAGCPYISIIAWCITQGQRSDQLLSRHCAIVTDGHKWGSQEAMYVHLVCLRVRFPSRNVAAAVHPQFTCL